MDNDGKICLGGEGKKLLAPSLDPHSKVFWAMYRIYQGSWGCSCYVSYCVYLHLYNQSVFALERILFSFLTLCGEPLTVYTGTGAFSKGC